MFTIRHRGKEQARVESLDDALKWLHAHQPESAWAAVASGGYDVRDGKGKRYFIPKRRFPG